MAATQGLLAAPCAASLAAAALTGSCSLVDCTHTIDASTLSFASAFNVIGAAQSPPQSTTPNFSIGASVDTRNAAGTGFRKCMYHMPCDVGTHIDSPAHWYPDGRDVSELRLEELTVPGAVIDVTAKVAAAMRAAEGQEVEGAGSKAAVHAAGGIEAGGDYSLSLADVHDFEATFGTIPERALVAMKTGWGAARWDDHGAYINGGLFPGFSIEAVRFLIEERHVAAIAVDTASLDVGTSTTFPVHCAILGSDRYQIENMKLDEVPAGLGSIFISLPLKVKHGPEAETRVMAIVPAQPGDDDR